MIQIGVIGASSCSDDIRKTAEEVGKQIALKKAILICGGMGGVMEAACFGAKQAGGTTIGILPTGSKNESNPYLDIKIPTDMGHARNIIVVRSSDVIIAVSGGFGTLSEISIAMKLNIPIIGLNTWNHESINIINCSNAKEAVDKAFELLSGD